MRHSTNSRRSVLVRLACVRHAASVRSEPGSNSQVDFVLRSRKTKNKTEPFHSSQITNKRHVTENIHRTSSAQGWTLWPVLKQTGQRQKSDCGNGPEIGLNPNNRRLRISSKTNNNVKEHVLGSQNHRSTKPKLGDKNRDQLGPRLAKPLSVATEGFLGPPDGFVKPKNSKNLRNFHFVGLRPPIRDRKANDYRPTLLEKQGLGAMDNPALMR